MHANEELPVYVVVDELLPDGDNVMYASTDKPKAYEYAEKQGLRVKVWNGATRTAKVRAV